MKYLIVFLFILTACANVNTEESSKNEVFKNPIFYKAWGSTNPIRIAKHTLYITPTKITYEGLFPPFEDCKLLDNQENDLLFYCKATYYDDISSHKMKSYENYIKIYLLERYDTYTIQLANISIYDPQKQLSCLKKSRYWDDPCARGSSRLPYYLKR